MALSQQVDAGHGPGVRGGSTQREPVGRVPGDAVGRAGHGRRRGRDADVGRRRRDGTPARLRGPGSCDGGRLPGRRPRRRRRRCPAPHARRYRRAGPAPAQGDRTRAGEGGTGAAAPRPVGGHATRRPTVGRTGADPDLRRAQARPRRHARGPRPGRPAPSPPAPRARGTSATTDSSRCRRRSSTPWCGPNPASPSACDPTTSRWSKPSSARRSRRRCCWTCRSRCRCAVTSSTPRRWRLRCMH